MILTDNKTKVDLLNNEAIATTKSHSCAIGPINQLPSASTVIAAGRPSVLELIKAGFAT